MPTIELRSFSFGELLSGAFLLVEADMVFDQFDIVSMIIAILISDLADIHFVWQKEMKGLGGAIYCARHHFNDEPFAVIRPSDGSTIG